VWQLFVTEPPIPPFGPPCTERDCRHGEFRRYNVPRTFASFADCVDFVKRAAR
jgi:hypothetical protein